MLQVLSDIFNEPGPNVVPVPQKVSSRLSLSLNITAGAENSLGHFGLCVLRLLKAFEACFHLLFNFFFFVVWCNVAGSLHEQLKQITRGTALSVPLDPPLNQLKWSSLC